MLHHAVVVPLQPHFEHVVLSTASSVILLPVWSLKFLRRLESCLQSHKDDYKGTPARAPMQRCTHIHTRQNKTVSAYSAITLFGSRSRPVPWLTAFIEKDNFTLSPRIWETGDRAAVILHTSLTRHVCVCVFVCECVCVCCYLSPNDFNPHLFPDIDNLWGVLNSWSWHLTHMYQACVCKGESVNLKKKKHKILRRNYFQKGFRLSLCCWQWNTCLYFIIHEDLNTVFRQLEIVKTEYQQLTRFTDSKFKPDLTSIKQNTSI